jgi:WD40 repeat protein
MEKNKKEPLLHNRHDTSTSENFEFEKTLQIRSHRPQQMVFDPSDSNTLVAGSDDATVKIWDINNGTYHSISTQKNEAGCCASGCVAINNDGAQLAFANYRTITLFDLKKKILQKVLTVKENKRAHDTFANQICCVAFNSQNVLAAGLRGDYTVYGQSTNTVTLYNTNSNSSDILTGDMETLKHVIFDPNEPKTLIATSYQRVSFWDIEKKELIRDVNNSNESDFCVANIAFHPTQPHVFVVTKNQHPRAWHSHSVEFWDSRTQKKTNGLDLDGFDSNGVFHSALDPQGNEIIASSYDLTQVFDSSTGKLIQTLPNKRPYCGGCICSSSVNSPRHNDTIKQIALSADGKTLATRAGTIKIWKR